MYKKLIIYIALFGLSAFTFGQVDYYSDIQPIFTNNCGDCHISSSTAGLNLSSYSNLMSGSNNGAVITPFDHSTSELWIRVNSGQMPPGGNDLSSSQVNLIAQWIDEGALEQPGGCTDPEAYK